MNSIKVINAIVPYFHFPCRQKAYRFVASHAYIAKEFKKSLK